MCMYVYEDFTEVSCKGLNLQYFNIGSDTGLTPTRRQAIIWINRKYKDYVCGRCQCRSTWKKIKNIQDVKIKPKNNMMYQDTYNDG